jgi:hypothetical protein
MSDTVFRDSNADLLRPAKNCSALQNWNSMPLGHIEIAKSSLRISLADEISSSIRVEQKADALVPKNGIGEEADFFITASQAIAPRHGQRNKRHYTFGNVAVEIGSSK